LCTSFAYRDKKVVGVFVRFSLRLPLNAGGTGIQVYWECSPDEENSFHVFYRRSLYPLVPQDDRFAQFYVLHTHDTVRRMNRYSECIICERFQSTRLPRLDLVDETDPFPLDSALRFIRLL
jgi:hypothetical protein